MFTPELTAEMLREYWKQYFRGEALENHIQWTLEHWEQVKDNKLPLRESLRCCEFARQCHCVCFESRWCPFHQKHCIGSHD